MKLRRRISSLQLLFTLVSFSFVTAETRAQDTIVTADRRTQTGKIIGVSGANVQIQIGAGTIGIPLATIASVTMPIPAEYTAGKEAYDKGDFAKALPAIKSVADRYKGLRIDWAQQAAGMLGDIYAATDKLAEAQAAYQDFQKLYGASGSARTQVGLARIAVSKNEYASAKAKLEPIAAQALKEKYPGADVAAAYSQTFCLLGQIDEANGDLSSALENYLRTVALYPADHAAVTAAQEHADAIRKNNPGITAP
jgi:tetratricopeptide (TPR) repeat protein